MRVHTDAQAAESARAVNALAYTVGSNIVFGHGEYSPRTKAGQRLLGHELAHVLQNSTGNYSGHDLKIGEVNSPAESEANRAADAVLRRPVSGPMKLSHDVNPTLHRWNISGNTAIADDPSDTLGGLAIKAGARFNDWKCIKPVRMRTNDSGRAPANFDARYELYVQIGDEFDISNLTATTGSTLRIYLFDDTSEKMNADLVRLFYPGSRSSLDADVDFDGAAGSGSTPIVELLIFGHSAGNEMWGGASTLFAVAHVGLFPRRCWFTRKATARLVGCNSETVGQDFAGHYLRKGAIVITTTKSVRPKCTAPLVDPSTGNCTAYDGLDFATGPSPGATSLDGPFWNVGDFHAGKFWKTIKGKL